MFILVMVCVMVSEITPTVDSIVVSSEAACTAQTSGTVVQLALPGGIPAREEVSFAGEITAHHDSVAGTTDPRVSDVRQISAAER